MTREFQIPVFAADDRRLDVWDNYPCDEGQIVLALGGATGNLKKVADIGGGAQPLLNRARVKENGLECTLLDISQAELDKAPDYYIKTRVDLNAPLDEFCALVGKERYDLMFSHDLLEHVKQPVRVHSNICAALKPGGLAVHFYPSGACLPLLINRLFPERITRPLLRVAQPHRDLDGRQGKFPAFYAMCGPPSKALHSQFERLGFNVIHHIGYIGHDYYKRVPLAREIEHSLRPFLCYAGIPMVSRSILVLQRRSDQATA